MQSVKMWFLQVLIAIDQLFNAILGGWADETLSSRAYRTEQKNKLLGIFFRPVIDTLALVFRDKDHCKMSYIAEKFRQQVAPELRDNDNS